MVFRPILWLLKDVILAEIRHFYGTKTHAGKSDTGYDSFLDPVPMFHWEAVAVWISSGTKFTWFSLGKRHGLGLNSTLTSLYVLYELRVDCWFHVGHEHHPLG